MKTFAGSPHPHPHISPPKHTLSALSSRPEMKPNSPCRRAFTHITHLTLVSFWGVFVRAHWAVPVALIHHLWLALPSPGEQKPHYLKHHENMKPNYVHQLGSYGNNEPYMKFYCVCVFNNVCTWWLFAKHLIHTVSLSISSSLVAQFLNGVTQLASKALISMAQMAKNKNSTTKIWCNAYNTQWIFPSCLFLQICQRNQLSQNTFCPTGRTIKMKTGNQGFGYKMPCWFFILNLETEFHVWWLAGLPTGTNQC